MEAQIGNYEQEQMTGHDRQTVILDPSLTAETDELNPAFNEQAGPPTDPEEDDDAVLEDEGLDGEGIDEDFEGDDEPDDTDFDIDDDPGLNHDEDDDLSLNTDDDIIY